MDNNQMLEVEFRKTYDVLTAVPKQELFLKLYLSFFKSGLVASLGPERTVALLALASFMNEEGRCFPTQDQIAERIGIHRSTANKWLGKLLEFRWNDKPIVSMAKVKSTNGYSNCVYTVQPISQLAIFDGQIEACEEAEDETYVPEDNRPTFQTEHPTFQNATLTRTNKQEPIEPETARVEEINGQEAEAVTPKSKKARDVATLFAQMYRQTYNVNYNINFSRDISLIKNKLLANYTLTEIEEMLGLIFREYDRRWAKTQYPRPTIGQLCTWLANEALALAEREKTERAEIARRMETAEAGADEITEDLLTRLSNGGLKR